MFLDQPSAPPVWLPPKPAIIRPAGDLNRRDRRAIEREFGVRVPPVKAMLPGLISPVISNSAPAPTLTYINGVASGTNASSYNFGNFNAPANGILLVGVSGPFGSQTASCSIDGGAGTLVPNSGGGAGEGGFWYKAVLSGNRNVTVTLNGSVSSCHVSVWLVTGYLDASPFAGAKVFNGTSTNSGSLTVNLLPFRSVACFVLVLNSRSDPVTWTGATERDDLQPGSDPARMSGADYSANGQEAPHSVSATWSGNSTSAFYAAVWR